MGQSFEKQLTRIVGEPPVLSEEDLLVERKGVVWNVDGSIRSCLFCDYASGKKEKKLLHKDELVIAFYPQRCAAKQHILIVPRERHISSVGELFPSDAHVLDHMRNVAADLLKKNGADPGADTRYCFHLPPWNSVDHLHMHALQLPFNYWTDRVKYSEGKPWCVSFARIREWVAVNKDVLDEDSKLRYICVDEESKPPGPDAEFKETLDDEEKSAETPVAAQA